MTDVSEVVAEDTVSGNGIERELDVYDEDGTEEIDGGFEAEANPRTDVQGLMVPIGQITGWQGGDPPADWLVRSVAKRLHNPILVRETGKKKHPYEVVDGRRRLKALREAKAKEVPVVIDNTGDDIDMLAIFLNSARSDNMAHSAKAVKAKLDAGQSDKDIALDAANGDAKLAANILPKIRALRDVATKLHPELFAAVEAGTMGTWAARMAARQPDVVQARLVAILNETGKVTPDNVVDARRAKQQAAAAEPEIVDAILDAPADLGDEDDDAEEYEAEEYDSRESQAADTYQGAMANGEPSISHEQRRQSAIRLLTAAAKEMGFIQATWSDVADCIPLVEDVITTLKEAS